MKLLSKFKEFLRNIYNYENKKHDYNNSLLLFVHIDNYGEYTIKYNKDEKGNPLYNVFDENKELVCTLPFETDLNDIENLEKLIIEKLS